MKKKKFKNILVNRIAIILPAIIFQGAWIYVLMKWLSPVSAILENILMGLSVVFAVYLNSKRDEPSYKILWLLIILVFPVMGAALYLIFGNKSSGRIIKRSLELSRKITGPPPKENLLIGTGESSLRISQIFGYVTKITGFPLCENGEAIYYPCGEKLFEDYIPALKAAKRYIYIEYFIIEDGVMWDAILDVLLEKAEAGVDIRVIYDDLGCLGTLPSKYSRYLCGNKIKCIKFNPFIFALTGRLNNRDHRKITVIDGITAFSGGINLADEYINEKKKFGYWKDIGFRLTGSGVDSFKYMFAEFWNAFSEDKIDMEIIKEKAPASAVHDGYVLPYYDCPVDKYAASCTLYSEILSRAEKYAWFFTPYLMFGDELMTSFVHAAERGVDVRIIMPGIPDKKMIFRISRCYYYPLIEAGVRIFEYEPGFVHAKACISDDIIGTVGSVNLDYRSLYLHFECNSVFYRSKLLSDLKADFTDTLSQCREITQKDLRSNIFIQMENGILRLLAPLC